METGALVEAHITQCFSFEQAALKYSEILKNREFSVCSDYPELLAVKRDGVRVSSTSTWFGGPDDRNHRPGGLQGSWWAIVGRF